MLHHRSRPFSRIIRRLRTLHGPQMGRRQRNFQPRGNHDRKSAAALNLVEFNDIAPGQGPPLLVCHTPLEKQRRNARGRDTCRDSAFRDSEFAKRGKRLKSVSIPPPQLNEEQPELFEPGAHRAIRVRDTRRYANDLTQQILARQALQPHTNPFRRRGFLPIEQRAHHWNYLRCST